jgi:DNA processing protein
MKDLSGYSVAAKIWALREFGGVGPRTFRTLMTIFGDLETIFKAEMDELTAIEGLTKKQAKKIYDCPEHIETAAKFIESLEQREIYNSTILDDDYPDLFGELNDPPPIIFYRGNLPRNDEKIVTIVGSEEGTSEGIGLTVDLAGKLAEKGISIVSGLSRGVDAATHLGAINASGKSYAVLGSGFDHIYPEDHQSLAIELVRKGGLITEYEPDVEHTPEQDIARHRLMVGLGQAVIIGELVGASPKTYDVAKFCHELGKLMFILIENVKPAGQAKAVTEKILDLGAIPIMPEDGVDLVSQSLVR